MAYGKGKASFIPYAIICGVSLERWVECYKVAISLLINKIKRHLMRLFPCVLISVCLTACGGGSGSNSTTTPTNSPSTVVPAPTILTGYFTDSAVQGLNYATETQSGVTDALGGFTYVEGESISFTIGTFVLGDTVAAKAEMTPLDLTAPLLSLPTTNGELNLLNQRSVVRPDHLVRVSTSPNFKTCWSCFSLWTATKMRVTVLRSQVEWRPCSKVWNLTLSLTLKIL